VDTLRDSGISAVTTLMEPHKPGDRPRYITILRMQQDSAADLSVLLARLRELLLVIGNEVERCDQTARGQKLREHLRKLRQAFGSFASAAEDYLKS
jgi:hypothetical protein